MLDSSAAEQRRRERVSQEAPFIAADFSIQGFGPVLARWLSAWEKQPAFSTISPIDPTVSNGAKVRNDRPARRQLNLDHRIGWI